MPPEAKALVYRCAFVSSLTSVLLGFDVGIFSGAILYIGSDLGLSTVQQEIIVGSLNLIAAFGGLIAGKVIAMTALYTLLSMPQLSLLLNVYWGFQMLI